MFIDPFGASPISGSGSGSTSKSFPLDSDSPYHSPLGLSTLSEDQRHCNVLLPNDTFTELNEGSLSLGEGMMKHDWKMLYPRLARMSLDATDP